MKMPKNTIIICSLMLFTIEGCSYKKIEFEANTGKTNTVKNG